MIVLVSKYCGVNWTQVFYRTGTNLVTGTTQTTPYIPTASTVWKVANIGLPTYTTSSNVLIKIVNVTDGGNNLYVDNINLGALITGVNENELVINDFAIYPNPNEGSFTVTYNIHDNEDLAINITDLLGRVVYSKVEKVQSSGSHHQQINLNFMQNGIYNVIIKTGEFVINKKMVVTK